MKMTFPTVDQLDQRVTLSVPTEATNTSGESVETFTEAFKSWAMVDAMGGGETFQAMRTDTNARIRVWIRYREAVDTTYRVTWRGVDYNVSDVLQHGRRQFLELICVEADTE